jgi:hypothetical protein
MSTGARDPMTSRILTCDDPLPVAEPDHPDNPTGRRTVESNEPGDDETVHLIEDQVRRSL